MKGAAFTQICAALSGPKLRADLHTHTHFSDGDFSPEELVLSAVRNQIAALAITDHDTTSAILHAQKAISQTRVNLKLVHGVEITCEVGDSVGEREFHLLAYGFDLENIPLQNALARLREGRATRIKEMAAQLVKLGVSSALLERFDTLAPERAFGRRHLAQALIELGASRNTFHAFSFWLSKPEVAGVSKVRLPLQEGIDLVRAASGVPILAHPPEDLTRDFFCEWKQRGLMGIECEYPWPSRSRSKALHAIAQELGLIATGGSDFHSTSSPRRTVGTRTVPIHTLKYLEKVE